MQKAQFEWEQAYDWEELRKYFYPVFSQGSTATIPLPSDWRKIAGSPINWSNSNSNGTPWPEIPPERKTLQSTTDKYFYIMGDQNNGFNMIWNPGSLNSGTSIEIQYFSVPPSLASAGQVLVVPDPLFIADRSTAYILEARYDPRFQEVEEKARDRLLMMVENEDAKKYTSYANQAYVLNSTRKQGFRLGRD